MYIHLIENFMQNRLFQMNRKRTKTNKMYKKITTLLLLFACSTGLFAQQPNLVKNGQFVAGTEGWEVLLNDANQPIKARIEQGSSYKEYGLADNFIGTNFVELDEKSAIQQKITTKVGEMHTLSFAYTHRPDAGNKQFIVAINGKAVYTSTVKNASGMGAFIYKNVSFKATETITKIAFYTVSLEGEADKGVLLTDIHCEQVVEGESLDQFSDIKY